MQRVSRPAMGPQGLGGPHDDSTSSVGVLDSGVQALGTTPSVLNLATLEADTIMLDELRARAAASHPQPLHAHGHQRTASSGLGGDSQKVSQNAQQLLQLRQGRTDPHGELPPGVGLPLGRGSSSGGLGAAAGKLVTGFGSGSPPAGAEMATAHGSDRGDEGAGGGGGGTGPSEAPSGSDVGGEPPLPTLFAVSLPLIRLGMMNVVDDSFSRCFKSQKKVPWNWNCYLWPAWAMGVVVRYGLLLPLRALALTLGFAVVGLAFPFVKAASLVMPTKKAEIALIQLLATAFVASWSGVVRIHGLRPTPRPGQPAGVFVANHSTMCDFILLLQSHPYAVVGQHHPGWVGFLQDYLLGSINCVWFNRGESKDRKLVAERLRAHAHDRDKADTPLLVFPEGTCVNNEYVVQFKKGVFELGVPINPVAIKYNKVFVDAYWNSRAQSFAQHLVTMMTSWAVVADIWFMDTQTQRPGETPAEFATRVQRLVAARAGLKPVDWDGYMKYWKPNARFIQRQQRQVADQLLAAMAIVDEPLPVTPVSSTTGHTRSEVGGGATASATPAGAPVAAGGHTGEAGMTSGGKARIDVTSSNRFSNVTQTAPSVISAGRDLVAASDAAASSPSQLSEGAIGGFSYAFAERPEAEQSQAARLRPTPSVTNGTNSHDPEVDAAGALLAADNGSGVIQAAGDALMSAMMARSLVLAVPSPLSLPPSGSGGAVGAASGQLPSGRSSQHSTPASGSAGRSSTTSGGARSHRAAQQGVAQPLSAVASAPNSAVVSTPARGVSGSAASSPALGAAAAASHPPMRLVATGPSTDGPRLLVTPTHVTDEPRFQPARSPDDTGAASAEDGDGNNDVHPAAGVGLTTDRLLPGHDDGFSGGSGGEGDEHDHDEADSSHGAPGDSAAVKARPPAVTATGVSLPGIASSHGSSAGANGASRRRPNQRG